MKSGESQNAMKLGEQLPKNYTLSFYHKKRKTGASRGTKYINVISAYDKNVTFKLDIITFKLKKNTL